MMGKGKMDEAAAERIKKARGERRSANAPANYAILSSSSNAPCRMSSPAELLWRPDQIKEARGKHKMKGKAATATTQSGEAARPPRSDQGFMIERVEFSALRRATGTIEYTGSTGRSGVGWVHGSAFDVFGHE